jgi:hypothetical protein
MCEYSGRLIAWMDCELPGDEAASVERHVRQCAECRRAVSEYEEVSGAFLACCEASVHPRRKTPVWTMGGVAAAAAVAAIVLAQPRAEQLAAYVPPPMHAPSMAFEKTPAKSAAVHVCVKESRPCTESVAYRAAAIGSGQKNEFSRRLVRLRRSPVLAPIQSTWIAVEPTVQVALPADALFPPGAVPQGFSFIADVRP